MASPCVTIDSLMIRKAKAMSALMTPKTRLTRWQDFDLYSCESDVSLNHVYMDLLLRIRNPVNIAGTNDNIAGRIIVGRT